jgi:hypothetical protein
VEKIMQAHGNYVEGNRFWGRKDDLRLFQKKIHEGAHQVLLAQRRMGKTSLMKETARLLGDSYTCLFVDLQKCRDSADAMIELSKAIYPHKKLWGKVVNVFSNIVGTILDRIDSINITEIGVTLRGGLTSADWSSKGDQLMAILADSDKPVLLLLDELPILVNRMLKGDDYTITAEKRGKADDFMSWLRQNSLQYQGKIRIVVSGSIGLDPILRQAGLSATMNNFPPFELKPWDESTAQGCLKALANQYNITFLDGADEVIVKRIGCCIPHHVQIFFDSILEACERRRSFEFKADEVEGIYDKEMLGVRCQKELTHYEERLKSVLGPELNTLAVEMLSEAAITGVLSREALNAFRKLYRIEGYSGVEAQQEIISVLEHDGYIAPGDGGYVFISNLIRDWWKKRNALFYTPVLEREV